jgi:hypothetical protein
VFYRLCFPACVKSFDEKLLSVYADWLVVLLQFFMESTSTVIAHGVHMLTVSLSQAGTAKTEKPFVRYTAYFWHFSSFKDLTKFIITWVSSFLQLQIHNNKWNSKIKMDYYVNFLL